MIYRRDVYMSNTKRGLGLVWHKGEIGAGRVRLKIAKRNTSLGKHLESGKPGVWASTWSPASGVRQAWSLAGRDLESRWRNVIGGGDGGGGGEKKGGSVVRGTARERGDRVSSWQNEIQRKWVPTRTGASKTNGPRSHRREG